MFVFVKSQKSWREVVPLILESEVKFTNVLDKKISDACNIFINMYIFFETPRSSWNT